MEISRSKAPKSREMKIKNGAYKKNFRCCRAFQEKTLKHWTKAGLEQNSRKRFLHKLSTTFWTFPNEFSHFSRLFRHLKHFNKQNFCEKLKSSESASWHDESFLKTDGNFRGKLAFPLMQIVGHARGVAVMSGELERKSIEKSSWKLFTKIAFNTWFIQLSLFISWVYRGNIWCNCAIYGSSMSSRRSPSHQCIP